MKKNAELSSVIEAFSQVDYVSFDVFDTLLSRPFKQPTDLFVYMEKEIHSPGFALERIKAERTARKQYCDQADVTLNQIYNVIPDRYKSLKTEELRFEYDFLYPKPEGVYLYKAAVKQKKHVIAISDMYLSSDFIMEVLKKNGYTAISHVFVSNEENCCKGDGKLFEKVIQRLSIDNKRVIHIGDNSISDSSAPENLGIQSIHRVADVDRLYFQQTPFSHLFTDIATKNCLESSVLIGTYAYHYAKGISKDPLREIGYLLGGPLAVGYASYIETVAKECGIDGLLFVSRDGYALREVYNLISETPITNYYVQASRKLILRNSIDYDETAYRTEVLKLFSKECLNGKPIDSSVFDVYADEIKKWAQKNNDTYAKYIDGLNISGNKLMTIDMTTREYTSLKLLKKVLGDKIDCGMFSVTFGEPCEYKVLSYADMHWKAGDEPMIMLQEQMITAPNFSVTSINEDGSYKYSDKSLLEGVRIENYKRILAGVLDFAKDVKTLYKNHRPPFTYEFWWDYAQMYIEKATESEKTPFKEIFHDDAVRGTFDTLYDILFLRKEICESKKAEENFRKENEELHQQLINNNSSFNRKNRKHLKWIRILSVVVFIELILLVILSLM